MVRLTVLYDSLCPVCCREVDWLRSHDHADALAVEDIAAPGFDPRRFGLTIEDCVGSLHAIAADGTLLRGMDTVRAMYDVVGLGWMMRWTAWRPVRPVADAAYRVFARVRPRLSRFDPAACDGGRCAVPARR